LPAGLGAAPAASRGAAGDYAGAKGSKVAIIGSGPAGLAAAHFLVLDGYEPTVFEKGDRLGGLLRTVVPAFRLPEELLDAQIDFYRRMGVSFRTGVQVGADVTLDDLRTQGYGAVIAASGAAKPVGLSVAGSDAAGIVSAMEFLAEAKADAAGGALAASAAAGTSGAVAVIGGGSVALDAARTALRLGASPVSLICLERLEPGSRTACWPWPRRSKTPRPKV